MSYYAAHDDRAVFAVSKSKQGLTEEMDALAGQIGVDIRTFEYDITECSKEFHDRVTEDGTPFRWINTEDGLRLPEELEKNPHAQALRAIPSKARAQASRENGKKGGRPRSEVRCGIEYPVGTPAPKAAKWAMWYQGYVRYYTTYDSAHNSMKRLDWHSRSEAEITELTSGATR